MKVFGNLNETRLDIGRAGTPRVLRLSCIRTILSAAPTKWTSARSFRILALDGISFGTLLGDSACDSNVVLADLDARGAEAVIAQHPRRLQPNKIDKEMYKVASLGRGLFCKLKELKRTALRERKRPTGTSPR